METMDPEGCVLASRRSHRLDAKHKHAHKTHQSEKREEGETEAVETYGLHLSSLIPAPPFS